MPKTIRTTREDSMVSLRDWIDERFTAHEHVEQLRAQSVKEALVKSEVANDRLFDSVNEFRGQLADQAQKFLTVDVYQARHGTIEAKLDALDLRIQQAEQTQANYDGRWLAFGVGLTVLQVGIALIMGLVSFMLRK